MSISDSQYQAWLGDPTAIFTFLVEVSVLYNGSISTVYLSTKPFKTSPTDIPPNASYDPCASVAVLFTEQLALDNSDSSISQGQLQISNVDGAKDAWLDPSQYVWANKPIRVYVGDVRWARTDFRMVFNGVISDIVPNDRTKFVFTIRDRLQQLNTPVSDQLIGGTNTNQSDLIPLAFGEVHNVTPELENPATLTYKLHTGPIQGIIEVRDNGVPLTGSSLPTYNLNTGRFTLTGSPAGTITASVQGDNAVGYSNTCAALVNRLLTGFGDVSTRLSGSDIDAANFNTFDTNHRQPMGLWPSGRTNMLDAIRMLTGSIGAQLSFSSQGLARLIQLSASPQGNPIVVTVADMDAKTLQPSARTTAVGAVSLGFARNWTVQSGLLSGIPQLHKDLFAKDWLTSNKNDATVQSNYKLSAAPVMQQTMLLTRADADAEAQRQLDLWKVPRTTFEFNGLANLFTLELGQSITVYHPRYGMSAGKTGTIISLARNWQTRRVKVGFLV